MSWWQPLGMKREVLHIVLQLLVVVYLLNFP